jgi:hypothetical protein
MYERSITIFGGHKSIMKSFARFRVHHLLTICLIAVVALFSVGCKSSRSNSGATANPLAAYTTTNEPNTYSGTIIGDGSTMVPGSLNTPVITVPDGEASSINGHDNAPLLDNKHPGWLQTDCLTCHNDTTNNPDHNYNDDSLCYLCHGTNGLAGMTDTVPPVLSGVVVSPTHNSVTISWKSDENCTSRLVIKTIEGDKMEFPVSTSYSTSHKRTVTGLQSSTTYYYELSCVDKSGNKTSSSSFSSVLSFITSAAPVVPVVTPTTEQESEETEPPESFFQNVKFIDQSGLKGKISFTTLSTPKVNKFYWYLYKTKEDAKAKNNKWIGSDDFNSNLTFTYSEQVFGNNLEAGKTYYIRVHAAMDGGGKWSNVYSTKLTN